MYWANVKGRFGHGGFTTIKSGGTSLNVNRSGAQRRIYLAVKYGNRWLNRVKCNKCDNNFPISVIGNF